MKLIEIYDWAEERGLNDNKPSREGFNAMITEELYERLVGIKKGEVFEIIDALCDISVFAVGEIYKFKFDAVKVLGDGNIADWITNDEDDSFDDFDDINEIVTYLLGVFLEAEDDTKKVEAIADMIRCVYKEIDRHEFDVDLCMEQVMKEISSRTGAYNEEATKWKKFKTPEAMALWYEADFSGCRKVI